jgi:hypothetical protein
MPSDLRTPPLKDHWLRHGKREGHNLPIKVPRKLVFK